MMTSNWKILLVGNSPIIQFYTSVLQSSSNRDSANYATSNDKNGLSNFDLFHVSDLKSNVFQMETSQYGKTNYMINNHFTSLDNLIEAISIGLDKTDKFKFNLVIFSPNSLRELHELPIKLNKLVNQKTILLLESTGYLNLEKFVRSNDNEKSSIISSNNVFSILTTHDIREVDDNKYRDFTNGKLDHNSIFLGQSIPINTTNKKSNENESAMNYSGSNLTNLQVLTKFFKTFFELDNVSNCNLNKLIFNSKQWNIAIQNICLNPLLIVFEETDLTNFPKKILINSLISGLISEVLIIARKTCNSNIFNMIEKNEQEIISTWKKYHLDDNITTTNSNNNNIPAFLYHFIHNKNKLLNLELLFVNPILLADECNINTPYLESLYSMMTQIKVINANGSKFLVRREELDRLINEKKLDKPKFKNDDLEEKLIMLNSKEKTLKEKSLNLSRKEIQLTERDRFCNERETKLNEREIQLSERETFLNKLQDQLNERQNQLTEKESSLQKKIANTYEQSSPHISQHASNSMIKSNSNNNINNTNFPRNITNHHTPLSVSTSKFIDPISTELSSPMDDVGLNMPYKSPHSTINHPIKPTSRKNRKNNILKLGNPSSVDFDSFIDQNDNSISYGNGSIPNYKRNVSNNHTNTMNSIRNTSGLGLSMSPNMNDNSFISGPILPKSPFFCGFSPTHPNSNKHTIPPSNSTIPNARSTSRNFSPINTSSPLNNNSSPLVTTPVRNTSETQNTTIDNYNNTNNSNTTPITPVEKINERSDSQEPHQLIQDATVTSSTPTPPSSQELEDTSTSLGKEQEKKSKKKFGFFKKKDKK